MIHDSLREKNEYTDTQIVQQEKNYLMSNMCTLFASTMECNMKKSVVQNDKASIAKKRTGSCIFLFGLASTINNGQNDDHFFLHTKPIL